MTRSIGTCRSAADTADTVSGSVGRLATYDAVVQGRADGAIGRLRRVLDRVLASRSEAAADDPEVWVRLRAMGADRYLVGWSRGYASDLSRAWSECPRADWLVDVIVRAGIEHALVLRAVREVGDRAVADVPELAAAVRGLGEIAERWAAGRHDADDLVAATAAISGAVADHGTARAVADRREGSSTMAPDELKMAAVHARLLADHEAHLAEHARLADGVRLHVSFAAIERALGSRKVESPYR